MNNKSQPLLSPRNPRLLTNIGHKISAQTKILIFIFGFGQKKFTKFCLNENFAGGLIDGGP